MQKIKITPSFGKNLRALRMAAGLTQEEIAAKLQLHNCDISRSSYSQIECGIHNIRITELVALKEILGVSYDAFFEGLSSET